MPSLEKLRPIAGDHSIQEAVFTIMLEDKIVSPRQFKKIHDGSLKKQLSKFSLVKRDESSQSPSTLSNTSTNALKDSTTGKTVGFSFDDVDPKTGAIKNRLRGTNDHVSWLYVNILKYPGYDTAKKNILSWFRKIASFQKGMKAMVVSVHYVDHLYWESSSPVPRNLVFNPTSKNLPGTLFDKLGWNFDNSYRFSENGSVRINNISILEQRNIKNKYTRFVIDMDLQYIFLKPRPLKALLNDKSEFGYSAICDRLHNENKDFLRDILSNEVSNMIGLNQGISK